MNDLIPLAREARDQAYAPYSHFAVGAALRAKSGRVFCGCNVENLSYGLTICAERNALFAAVAAGEREFEAIAIVADSKEPVTPCGACRQVLAEFAPELAICCANLEGQTFEATLRELLPRAKEGILGT
ncbi:MAG: cytidine deaminase [Chthoniobacter sp.]|jgi:cytidine deaminase|nr:cytidine deaminase [Chthoniobacter sp.]